MWKWKKPKKPVKWKSEILSGYPVVIGAMN